MIQGLLNIIRFCIDKRFIKIENRKSEKATPFYYVRQPFDFSLNFFIN